MIIMAAAADIVGGGLMKGVAGKALGGLLGGGKAGGIGEIISGLMEKIGGGKSEEKEGGLPTPPPPPDPQELLGSFLGG